jgi:hypothetical protein
MEEAPENSKESSYSAHVSGMNESNKCHYVKSGEMLMTVSSAPNAAQ